MTAPLSTWQSVRDEVLRRIRARDWPPGEMIPNEADLAEEFGCARATVNRALRAVAETGLIERRRKAGTRVALHPVRKATLDIPVIRVDVESRGETYAYRLLAQREEAPPAPVRARMTGPGSDMMLHLTGLHLADGLPHAFEDRWIDPAAVPGAAEVDFTRISPNEWLVLNIPFDRGDIAFSAVAAGPDEARALDVAEGAALFVVDRTTWRAGQALTDVRLLFGPGYRLHTLI